MEHATGAHAVYIPAQLEATWLYGVFVEEENIILTPNAPPPTSMKITPEGKGADRTTIDGPLIIKAPIPDSYTTEGYIGSTPNHAAAILPPDGRTLHNSQPFTRHHKGGYATSDCVIPIRIFTETD